MSKTALPSQLKKFKRLLLTGKSIPAVCQTMKIGKTTGYEFAKKLEYLGEIRRVPGTLSPILYEDAKKGGCFGGAGSVENSERFNPVVESEKTDSATLSELSRPDKLVRAHFAGAWVVRVEEIGERPIRLADGQGYTIGGWKREERITKGTRVHDGFLYGYHEQIKFKLYLASAGPKLNIYPRPRQVYYKTATIDGPRALETQCLEVCRVLERYGWKFDGRPALSGIMHYGDIDPRLLGLTTREHQDDNAPVHSDASGGEPEVEIYGDSPTAQRDIDILSTLPERIVSITSALIATQDALTVISDTMGELMAVTASMQATQAQSMEMFAKAQAMPMTAPSFDSRGYF